jgi:hypothetical protein
MAIPMGRRSVVFKNATCNFGQGARETRDEEVIPPRTRNDICVKGLENPNE